MTRELANWIGTTDTHLQHKSHEWILTDGIYMSEQNEAWTEKKTRCRMKTKIIVVAVLIMVIIVKVMMMIMTVVVVTAEAVVVVVVVVVVIITAAASDTAAIVVVVVIKIVIIMMMMMILQYQTLIPIGLRMPKLWMKRFFQDFDE